ncbi:MAG: hypothetical protein MRY63_00350 [Neomegalonema sp.]|nr:hypothetical protein [Neomegalonema sp.]
MMDGFRNRARKSLAALIALSGLALASPAHAEVEPGEWDVPDLEYTRYGEHRAYYRDWLAACRASGYCSVLAYDGAGPDAAGVDADYILRVASAREGVDYALIFTGVEAFPAADAPIEMRIDGRKISTFAAGADAGWVLEPGGAVNEALFGQSISNLEVIPAMKAGARLSLRFVDEGGTARDVTFSLMGLTDALIWIEGNRMR